MVRNETGGAKYDYGAEYRGMKLCDYGAEYRGMKLCDYGAERYGGHGGQRGHARDNEKVKKEKHINTSDMVYFSA